MIPVLILEAFWDTKIPLTKFLSTIVFFEIMVEVELLEKTGTTSYIWMFFGLKEDSIQDSEQVICRVDFAKTQLSLEAVTP